MDRFIILLFLLSFTVSAAAVEKEPNFLLIGGPDKMTLNSGITVVSQRASGVLGVDKSMAYSADISISGQIKKHGYVYLSLESSQGVIINSASTSPNNDYRAGVYPGFEDTRVYEARYDICFSNLAYLTIGKIDVSGYFDKNVYAKDEGKDFIATVMLDNPAIPYPRYATGGINLTVDPTKAIRIRAGLFESADEFSGSLDSNFSMAEFTYKNKKKNRTGNYRFSFWSCDNCDNVNQKGMGINLDQALGADLGVFARLGTKNRATLARPFKLALQGGLQKSFGKHRLGFALANLKAEAGEDERYAEVFFDFAFVDNIHLALDLQYIQNPNFSAIADPVVVYGIRSQVDF